MSRDKSKTLHAGFAYSAIGMVNRAGLTSTELAGRALEVAVLEEVVERVRGGSAAATLVEGEAGIGKSALASVAVAAATRTGLRVLEGTTDELELERPFGLVADIFALTHRSDDEAGGRLAKLLFPSDAKDLADIGPPAGSARLIEELVDLVEIICLGQPLLIVLEDIQWADTTSLSGLRRVVRRMRDLPLGVVATSRPTRRRDVARFVSELVSGGATHLTLPPLDDDSLAEIADSRLGRMPGPNLMDRLRRTGGNPFLANELLRAYSQDDMLQTADQTVEVAPDAFPPSLSNVILRRVHALGHEAHRLLRHAAMLGRSFAVADLEATSNWDRVEVLEMLQLAMDVGLLRDKGDRVSFHHDLVREVLYLDIAEVLRREMHADLARALADRGAPPVTVAAHISYNPHPGDEFDISWLRRAAEDAATRDPAVGARFLEQAIALCDPTHPNINEMKNSHVQMTLWSGDSGRGEAVARAYLDAGVDEASEPWIRLSLIRSLIAQCRFLDAVAESSTAIAAGPRGSVSSRIKAEAAYAHLFAGMVDAARNLAGESLREGEAADDAFARANARFAMGLMLMAKGRAGEAVEWVEEGFKDAAGSRDPEWGRGPYLGLGAAVYLYREDIARSEAVIVRAIDLLTASGTTWMMTFYLAALGHMRTYAGHWDDALAEFDTAVRAADETLNHAPIPGVRAAEAQILARRGDLATGLAALDEGQRLIDEAGGTHWNGPDLARARAVLLEMQGEVDRSFAILTNLWQITLAMGMEGFAAAAASDVALLALRHDQRDVLMEVLPTLEIDEDQVAPSVYAASLCSRGAAHGDLDTIDAGLATFENARNALQRGLWNEECALVFHALSDPGRCRSAGVRAAKTYEDLGATQDLARLQKRMRSLGIRVGRGSNHRKDKTGWSALTRTELSIAELVRDGLRNAEIATQLFVSSRTVETHLTNIYRKLGIRSRAQLVRVSTEETRD